MAIIIEPYDPGWKTEFEKIRQVLEAALAGKTPPVNIQHVGSTSVEGLVAKPILDIDMIMHHPEQLGAITSTLENIGYHAKGEQGIPGRFAFGQVAVSTPLTDPPEAWQAHHLYVCYHDSLALKNHLLFRDALRANADLVKSYADLKLSLVSHSNLATGEYVKRKTDFILSVLAAAGLNDEELRQIKDVNT